MRRWTSTMLMFATALLMNAAVADAQWLSVFPAKPPGVDSASASGPSSREMAPAEQTLRDAAMLDGIYAGLTRSLVAGAMGVDIGISTVYVTFYPDGRVYRRVPEGGLEDWDRDAAERAAPDLWGRYRPLGPDRWAIDWNDADQPAAVFREGLGLRYEDVMVFPVATCEGLALNAIYARPGYQGEENPYFIAFNDEGLFMDRGLIGSLAYEDLNRYESRTIAGGVGHYRIGKNTLHLEYDDGRRVPVEIHARPEDVDLRPIPAIYINGWELVLVQESQ